MTAYNHYYSVEDLKAMGTSVHPTFNNMTDVMDWLFPSLSWNGENYSCPVNEDCGEGCVVANVIHLNDDHDWTRERIADWLETLDIDMTFKVG